MSSTGRLVSGTAACALLIAACLPLTAAGQAKPDTAIAWGRWQLTGIAAKSAKAACKDVNGAIIRVKPGFRLVAVDVSLVNKRSGTAVLEIDVNQVSAMDRSGRNYPVIALAAFDLDYFPSFSAGEAGAVIEKPVRIEWSMDRAKHENKLWVGDVRSGARVPLSLLFAIPAGGTVETLTWHDLRPIRLPQGK